MNPSLRYPVADRDLQDQFRTFGWSDFQGPPSFMQWRIMSAVREALTQGLSYTSEVYAFVCNAMQDLLSEDLLAIGKKHVENGEFGMHIYYARKAVEAQLRLAANIQSLRALQQQGFVTLGRVIKGPFRYASKSFTSMQVESINQGEGEITLIGKTKGRGGPRRFTVNANRSDFLALFPINVTDKRCVATVKEGILTFTIDPTANYHQELFAQAG